MPSAPISGRALWRLAFRLRYVALVGWGVLWMLPPNHYTLPLNNDWIPFEVGARTLVHYHHIKAFQTPALHLYADTPFLQFGPLPIYLLAAFQSFKPHAVATGFCVAMITAGVVSIAALESAACALVPPQRQAQVRRTTFAIAAVLVPIWSFEVGFWHHLDDVLALLCVCLGLRVIATRGAWWLLAALLGTAAATKPWAVVCTPLLLALPREKWAKTALATIATGIAWWLPFLLAAPGTLGALGGYATFPYPGSVWFLLGVHANGADWLRPLQLGAGLAAVGYVTLRGRWRDALLVGSAVRILLDPFSFSYYVFGPMLGALLVDVTERKRLPRWTLGTLAFIWLLPRMSTHSPLWGVVLPPVHLPTLSAIARLVWALAVVARLVTPDLWRRMSLTYTSTRSRRDRVSASGAASPTSTVSSILTPPLSGR